MARNVLGYRCGANGDPVPVDLWVWMGAPADREQDARADLAVYGAARKAFHEAFEASTEPSTEAEIQRLRRLTYFHSDPWNHPPRRPEAELEAREMEMAYDTRRERALEPARESLASALKAVLRWGNPDDASYTLHLM